MPRPSDLPRARQSTHDTAYSCVESSSVDRAKKSSTESKRISVTRMRLLRTGSNCNCTQLMTPVRPRPPIEALYRSAFSCGDARTMRESPC